MGEGKDIQELKWPSVTYGKRPRGLNFLRVPRMTLENSRKAMFRPPSLANYPPAAKYPENYPEFILGKLEFKQRTEKSLKK